MVGGNIVVRDAKTSRWRVLRLDLAIRTGLDQAVEGALREKLTRNGDYLRQIHRERTVARSSSASRAKR